jgi:RHS repeat-associated protein
MIRTFVQSFSDVDAGNVTTDNKFRTMAFGYDANGRMVKATKTSVPDALSVYDAAGMRVAERVNDLWRFLVYDVGGKLVAEYGGPQSTDEGGVKYLLSDWQGSTRAVLSNTGVVNSRADYTAFGEEIASGTGLRTAAQGFGGNQNPRQKYGLTERDDATGLDHTWFRKNENRAGRWTSPDPYNGSASIGNPQSFNRYAYVTNEPTNFVDPSGLITQGPPRAGCTYDNQHGWSCPPLEIPGIGHTTWDDRDPGYPGDWEFGGGGGGEGAKPPPRCTVTVAGSGPLLGGEMEQAGGTELGPVEVEFAIQFQVEVRAKFAPTFPQTVKLNQVKLTSSTIMSGPNPKPPALPYTLQYGGGFDEDTADPDRHNYDRKNGVAYMNDAPGLTNYTGGVSGVFDGHFTSYASDPKTNVRLCSVDWHVRVTAAFGKMTSYDFGIDRTSY